jgi:hypothetical protein
LQNDHLAVSNGQTKEQTTKINANYKISDAKLAIIIKRIAKFAMLILHFALEV